MGKETKEHGNEVMAGGETGAVLVMLIISIVIIASIGTALLSTTSTSIHTQIGSVGALKAYFLAEAGKRYALPYIEEDIDDSGNGTIPVGLLHNKTFTLPQTTSTFTLTLSTANCPSGPSCTYTLTSTGSPDGVAERTLTYSIIKSD